MKARKVKKATLKMVGKHVDVEDLYVTQTIEQSDRSLDEIIEKRYQLVFCGGGDGTAMRVMEQMRLKVDQHNQAGGDYQMPKFGLLKLGTGNGWAGYLGYPSKVRPIWAIRRNHDISEMNFENFNLIESEKRVFHFGGFGVDGLIINDYLSIKKHFTKGFFWWLANSLFGYLFAITMRTIPTAVFKGIECRAKIINDSDDPIYKITVKGGAKELPVGRGETIFEGLTKIIGFSTTCNYGFKFKLYPFAQEKKGYMQLRLANPSVPLILGNIHKIWTGTWDNPELHDFLVKKVRIELDREMPLQLGGDPEGYRDRIEVAVSDFTVDLLDFRKAAKD